MLNRGGLFIYIDDEITCVICRNNSDFDPVSKKCLCKDGFLPLNGNNATGECKRALGSIDFPFFNTTTTTTTTTTTNTNTNNDNNNSILPPTANVTLLTSTNGNINGNANGNTNGNTNGNSNNVSAPLANANGPTICS